MEIAAEETIRQNKKWLKILDPFAGIGRIHLLREYGHRTVGIELEEEWALQSEGTICGDMFSVGVRKGSFDAVFTSPCYGNRMSDSHNAQEICSKCKGSGEGPDGPVCKACGGKGRRDYKRHTYKHYLDRQPHEGSSTVLAFGSKYMEFHARAWLRCLRQFIKPGGLLVVNSSNHLKTLKKGDPPVEQMVNEFHLGTLLNLGCRLVEVRRIQTERLRHGANHESRVEDETIMVVRTPGA